MNNIILVTWIIEGPDNRGPDNRGSTITTIQTGWLQSVLQRQEFHSELSPYHLDLLLLLMFCLQENIGYHKGTKAMKQSYF